MLGAADYVRQGAEGSGEERERGLEEVKDEELYVMPGWGVVRYRDEKVAKGAPGESNSPRDGYVLGELRWSSQWRRYDCWRLASEGCREDVSP